MWDGTVYSAEQWDKCALYRMNLQPVWPLEDRNSKRYFVCYYVVGQEFQPILTLSSLSNAVGPVVNFGGKPRGSCMYEWIAIDMTETGWTQNIGEADQNRIKSMARFTPSRDRLETSLTTRPLIPVRTSVRTNGTHMGIEKVFTCRR